ncbi:hypothetical protein [Streptomyces sp. TE33382]
MSRVRTSLAGQANYVAQPQPLRSLAPLRRRGPEDQADGACLRAGTATMDALVDLPPMVIADLLGIHPTTAERWATLAGENWCDYVSLLM